MVAYRPLIESLVAAGHGFSPTVESASAAQVERSVVLADAMAGRAGPEWPGVRPRVVDAADHCRPIYRAVLSYAYLAAGVVTGSPPPTEPELADPDVPFTAAAGAEAAAVVWSALALHAGSIAFGRSDWATAARAVFERLVTSQAPSGALLRATSSDNPETHWYHELVTLHAAADYAAWTGDPAVSAAVERAVRFHLAETEPDHATGQPWGLSAFVRVPGAEPLVDAALHAVSAHQASGPGGLTLFLLADTLYGLRHATPHPATREDRSP
jgi:hypothetical protein